MRAQFLAKERRNKGKYEALTLVDRVNVVSPSDDDLLVLLLDGNFGGDRRAGQALGQQSGDTRVESAAHAGLSLPINGNIGSPKKAERRLVQLVIPGQIAVEDRYKLGTLER